MPEFGLLNLHTPMALLLYFIPSIVASTRNRDNCFSIFAVNLVLGWTVVGWIGALVWAIYKPTVHDA